MIKGGYCSDQPDIQDARKIEKKKKKKDEDGNRE